MPVKVEVRLQLIQNYTWRKYTVNKKLRPFYIRERTFTYCTGGWVDLVAILESKKFHAPRDLFSRIFKLSQIHGECSDPSKRK